MARSLRWLMLATGVVCVAIGVFHFVLGIASVPGESSGNALADATMDSRERFYAAIFLGYGLAWIWAARQSPISATVVRWLAGVFLLGAAGRILSLIVDGRPQWFQLVLTAVEVVLPPLFFLLASAGTRATPLRSK